MKSLIMIIFAILVAISVTIQSRLLTYLEAAKVQSGMIFASVAVVAGLLPVILYALAVVMLSREHRS